MSVAELSAWCYTVTHRSVAGSRKTVGEPETTLSRSKRSIVNEATDTHSTDDNKWSSGDGSTIILNNDDEEEVISLINYRLNQTTESTTNSHKRHRRSNLAYWLSLGPLTSSYIDNEVAKVRDADTLSIEKLRDQISSNTNARLNIDATRKKQEELTHVFCDVSTELTEQLINNKLNDEVSSLTEQVDLTIESCNTEAVPLSVQTALLEKLCQIHSQNAAICYTLRVRTLFRCTLEFVELNDETVLVHLGLTLYQPLQEDYRSYRTTSIPKYTMTAEHEVKEESTTKTTTPADNLAQERLHKLMKVLDVRQKRSAQSMFETMRLVLPKYIVAAKRPHELSDDDKVFGFGTKSCQQSNSLILCDLSMSDPHSKCARTLVKSASSKPPTAAAIESVCLHNRELTFHECQARKIVDENVFLLSTSEGNPIQINHNQADSMFEKKNQVECTDTCLIRLVGKSTQFTCEGNQFELSQIEQINENIQYKEINTKVDLRNLRNTKEDLQKLPFIWSSLSRSPQSNIVRHFIDAFTTVVVLAAVCLVTARWATSYVRAMKCWRRFKRRKPYPTLLDPKIK